MPETVIELVLGRLKEIGVDDIFGVPGDFAFPVQDAIVEHPAINWIGCCNELNAAYAADGYARMRGVGAVSTTYGVGELSAISAVGGSYAEHLPVLHLSGMPNLPSSRRGDSAGAPHAGQTGEYDLFRRMADTVVCASAIITPQNAALETERRIVEALYHLWPVLHGDSQRRGEQPSVLAATPPLGSPTSEPESLAAATEAVAAAPANAGQACVLPGVLLMPLGLQGAARAFVDASRLPFATMFLSQ